MPGITVAPQSSPIMCYHTKYIIKKEKKRKNKTMKYIYQTYGKKKAK